MEKERCEDHFKVAVKAQKCLVTFIFLAFFGLGCSGTRVVCFVSQISAWFLSQGRCFVRLLSRNFDRRRFDVFLSATSYLLVFPFIMIRPGETKSSTG